MTLVVATVGRDAMVVSMPDGATAVMTVTAVVISFTSTTHCTHDLS
jgi:hypothetical protein